MPKIMCIGDPHIQAENIPEVNLFILRLCELITEQKPDMIVVLGDLLHNHERVHSTAMNKTVEFILQLRKFAPVYILVGNHDMYNNQQFLTENHWMNGLKEWENVTIVDKVVYSSFMGLNLFFVPYVPPKKFQDALNTLSISWKEADCIFAHQEFYGCKMGAITSIDGDKWPLDYPEIVSGHIHSNQRPQKNIYYCGSAMQHAYGESEHNIIPILYWEKSGKYKLTEHDLKLPRKRIIYKEVSAMDDYKPENTEDKIKITLTGVYDEFKAFKKTKKYNDLVKSGKKIIFKPKKLEISEEKRNDDTDFNNILLNLVNKEKNSYLSQVYDLVIKK